MPTRFVLTRNPCIHEFWLHSTHTMQVGNYPVLSPIESWFYGAVAILKIAELIYLYILFFRSPWVIAYFEKHLHLFIFVLQSVQFFY